MKRPRGFSYDSDAEDAFAASASQPTPHSDTDNDQDEHLTVEIIPQSGTNSPRTADLDDLTGADWDETLLDLDRSTEGDNPTEVLPELEPIDRLAGNNTEVVVPSNQPSERRSLRVAKRRVKEAERDRKRRERKERRRFTQHQRVRRWKGLALSGAVLLVAAFVAVGVFTPIMAVETVEVRGAERVEESLIVEALDGVVGTPLALVTDDDVREALLGMPLLLSYEIEKIPPQTLRVVVRERQPVVAIPQGENLRLVDPAGVEIVKLPSAERPDGIPVAKGVGEAFESETFVAMTTALQSMPKDLRERIVEINAETPQQIQLMLSDGLVVVWGDPAANARKALVLESMLEALTDVSVRTIDVSSPDAPVYVPG